MKLGNDQCKCIIDKFILKSVIKIHNLCFIMKIIWSRGGSAR